MEWEGLKARLAEYGQEHLLGYLGELNELQKKALYQDIHTIDLKKITKCWKEAKKSLSDSEEMKDDQLKPLPSSIVGSTTDSREEVDRWKDMGLKKISEGEVAVLLLAGGQGTRLGVSYPKGMFDVGLPSKKTLYQLQAERILRLQNMAHKKYGKSAVIPWYIMTSDYTKLPTLEFFKKNDYFGLQSENVVVFEQYTLPCLDFEGHILLKEKHAVARAPDGNGGLYTALASPKNHVLEDMERRGIKCIHIYCVDNILVKMADPVFMGFCHEKNAECGAKVVQKILPTEKVGVVCCCNDHYQVVEYSEISSEIAEMRDPDGTLTFKAGNICNHFLTLEFLKKVCRTHEDELVHHVAKKKIPFINNSGEHISPKTPNGIKLEKFVFDIFQFAKKFAVLEVPREDEFSPLKNACGAEKDTPDTARWALMDLHYRQLLEAGGSLINNEGDTPIATRESSRKAIEEGKIICEISPLVSYFGEGLKEFCCGQSFHLPVHIISNGNGTPKLSNST